MEADLGSRLDWVAVNHWNTDNPHTHIVLRGKDDTGKDLIISQAYITRGMRERAAELSTEWLGPRTELEIQRTLMREVDQERWTSLDRALQREARDRLNHVDQPAGDPKLRQQRVLLVGRLQRLQRMGLASEQLPGVWAVHADAEPVLRAMGERGDIIRTMQRAMGGAQRDLAVFQPGEESRSVIGRVAGKGLADELYDKGYLVVDGIDGKAHYVTLPAKTELAQYPIGAVVEARGSTKVRALSRQEHRRVGGRRPVPHRPSPRRCQGAGHVRTRSARGGRCPCSATGSDAPGGHCRTGSRGRLARASGPA